MDKELMKSMHAIVDYLALEESKDYHNMPPSKLFDKARERHIYNDILVVRNWLDEQN